MAARPETRVIILTTFGRPGYLRRAMEAGAVGYMVKDAPAEQLIEGSDASTRDCGWSTPLAGRCQSLHRRSPLTAREIEVLVAASSGASTSAIAGQPVPLRGHGPQPPLVGDGQARGRGRAEAVRIATETAGWASRSDEGAPGMGTAESLLSRSPGRA